MTLSIYDLRGRRVVALFAGTLAGSTQRRFIWDGNDGDGQPVASGVYFTRAEVAGKTTTRKLLLVR